MTIAPADITLVISAPIALVPIALAQFFHLAPLSAISNIFAETAAQAQQDKKTYTEKLESAEGDDIFKYILLINVSALEGYVAQTRIQAEQSFRLARSVASLGFGMLGVGIVLAIYLSALGRPALEGAYLAAIAGVLTEFISGVFFYLYNRTLQQINRFHDKLVTMQQTSMAYLATGLLSDPKKGDDARVDLAKRTTIPPQAEAHKDGQLTTASRRRASRGPDAER